MLIRVQPHGGVPSMLVWNEGKVSNTYRAITMDNDIAMNILLCISTPNYDITVSPVNSLKLYT